MSETEIDLTHDMIDDMKMIGTEAEDPSYMTNLDMDLVRT